MYISLSNLHSTKVEIQVYKIDTIKIYLWEIWARTPARPPPLPSLRTKIKRVILCFFEPEIWYTVHFAKKTI